MRDMKRKIARFLQLVEEEEDGFGLDDCLGKSAVKCEVMDVGSTPCGEGERLTTEPTVKAEEETETKTPDVVTEDGGEKTVVEESEVTGRTIEDLPAELEERQETGNGLDEPVQNVVDCFKDVSETIDKMLDAVETMECEGEGVVAEQVPPCVADEEKPSDETETASLADTVIYTPSDGGENNDEGREINMATEDVVEDLETRALEVKRLVLLSSSSESDEEDSENDVESCKEDVDNSTSAKEDLAECAETTKEDGKEKEASRDEQSGENVVEVTEHEPTATEEKGALEKSVPEKRAKPEEDEAAREEKELKNLTNLSTLERKREDKEEEGEETSENKPKTSRTPKGRKEELAETLKDFLNVDSSDAVSEGSQDEKEESKTVIDSRFLQINGLMLKQMLLETSSDDSDGNSSSSSDKPTPSKTKAETTKRESKATPTKRPSWMNDRLLKSSDDSELSSGEEDRRWERAREREQKARDTSFHSRFDPTFQPTSESSNSGSYSSNSGSDSSDSSASNIESAVKKKRSKPMVSSDAASVKEATPSSEDSDTDIEQIFSQKSEDSPCKGRKNIKRILRKDSLHVETRQALKMETERRKRIGERHLLEQQLFPDAGDSSSRLVLDFDPETGQPLVTVHRKLVKKLKPHQRKGVKFMWDNCFESLQRMEEESGSGCILAHCMGLGKTLQVVTLVHTLLTHDTGVKTVLVVCPINTVNNWLYEFHLWLKNVGSRITLFDIIKYKTASQRARQLHSWHTGGGVLVLSYTMLRILTSEKRTAEDSSLQRHRATFETCLMDPGPDVVVCDEGHLLKNADTSLSKAMDRIKALRRIVLTGTPLQNNLVEFHCMVQFIKPNILGSKAEFMNRFANPIQNGQFEDSTPHDVQVMKRRSHVLHNMLEGCIQRFDYTVLTPYLPPKHEYVISIALTEAQARAYRHYLDHVSGKSDGPTRSARLFSDYQNLQRIWTHPLTLLAHKTRTVTKNVEHSDGRESSDDSVVFLDDTAPPAKANKDWWLEFFKESDYEDMRACGKLPVLFAILRESKAAGDKVLVFSQSLYSLNLIEHFLCKINEASAPDDRLAGYTDTWELGRDYFRLDGSTSSDMRAQWCRLFNRPTNTRARLFLISTKAGGLGINLVSANRVVIFNASWNPSHDVQSIFRVYRFGQEKTCYIYRFLAEATMEEKIYERQVTKLSLARRVVDEHQIERHYTMRTLMELYAFEPTPGSARKTPIVPKDVVLAKVLKEQDQAVVAYHEHDSLLENKHEEVLTEAERKAAWEEFEKEPVRSKLDGVLDQLVLPPSLPLEPRRTFQVPTNPLPQDPLQELEGMFKKLTPMQLLTHGRRLGLWPREGEDVNSFINKVVAAQMRQGPLFP